MGLLDKISHAVTGRDAIETDVLLNQNVADNLIEDLNYIRDHTIPIASTNVVDAATALNSVNNITQCNINLISPAAFESVFTDLASRTNGFSELVAERKSNIEEYSNTPWYEKFLATVGLTLDKSAEGFWSAAEDLYDGAFLIGNWIGLVSDETAQEKLEYDWAHSMYEENYKYYDKHSLFTSDSGTAGSLYFVGKMEAIVIECYFGGEILGAATKGVSAPTYVANLLTQAGPIGGVLSKVTPRTVASTIIAATSGSGSGAEASLLAGNDFDTAKRDGLERGLKAGAFAFAMGAAADNGAFDPLAQKWGEFKQGVKTKLFGGGAAEAAGATDDALAAASEVGDDGVAAAKNAGGAASEAGKTAADLTDDEIAAAKNAGGAASEAGKTAAETSNEALTTATETAPKVTGTEGAANASEASANAGSAASEAGKTAAETAPKVTGTEGAANASEASANTGSAASEAGKTAAEQGDDALQIRNEGRQLLEKGKITREQYLENYQYHHPEHPASGSANTGSAASEAGKTAAETSGKNLELTSSEAHELVDDMSEEFDDMYAARETAKKNFETATNKYNELVGSDHPQAEIEAAKQEAADAEAAYKAADQTFKTGKENYYDAYYKFVRDEVADDVNAEVQELKAAATHADANHQITEAAYNKATEAFNQADDAVTKAEEAYKTATDPTTKKELFGEVASAHKTRAAAESIKNATESNLKITEEALTETTAAAQEGENLAQAIFDKIGVSPTGSTGAGTAATSAATTTAADPSISIWDIVKPTPTGAGVAALDSMGGHQHQTLPEGTKPYVKSAPETQSKITGMPTIYPGKPTTETPAADLNQTGGAGDPATAAQAGGNGDPREAARLINEVDAAAEATKNNAQQQQEQASTEATKPTTETIPDNPGTDTNPYYPQSSGSDYSGGGGPSYTSSGNPYNNATNQTSQLASAASAADPILSVKPGTIKTVADPTQATIDPTQTNADTNNTNNSQNVDTNNQQPAAIPSSPGQQPIITQPSDIPQDPQQQVAWNPSGGGTYSYSGGYSASADPAGVINNENEVVDAPGLELEGLETTTASIDDVIKGSKYTKIPTSTTPIQQTPKSTGNAFIPIAAGLSAAAAAGIGAKAYMDRKNNNYNGEDDFESSDWSEDDLEGYSGDDEEEKINTIEEETLDDDDYSYQEEPEKYGARNNEELADIQ